MAKSKTDKDDAALAEYERRLVEVDGEFCVPQEAGQARHYIDLGPIFGMHPPEIEINQRCVISGFNAVHWKPFRGDCHLP